MDTGINWDTIPQPESIELYSSSFSLYRPRLKKKKGSLYLMFSTPVFWLPKALVLSYGHPNPILTGYTILSDGSDKVETEWLGYIMVYASIAGHSCYHWPNDEHVSTLGL